MNKVLSIAARLTTGLPYVVLGAEAASNPGMRVDIAAPLLDSVKGVVPVPVGNELIVRANGALQAVGGGLVATGVAPRAGAFAVLASLIPTTVAGHSYWQHDDPAMRKQQQVQFVKNVTMAGGLLAIAAASRR